MFEERKNSKDAAASALPQFEALAHRRSGRLFARRCVPVDNNTFSSARKIVPMVLPAHRSKLVFELQSTDTRVVNRSLVKRIGHDLGRAGRPDISNKDFG